MNNFENLIEILEWIAWDHSQFPKSDLDLYSACNNMISN